METPLLFLMGDIYLIQQRCSNSKMSSATLEIRSAVRGLMSSYLEMISCRLELTFGSISRRVLISIYNLRSSAIIFAWLFVYILTKLAGMIQDNGIITYEDAIDLNLSLLNQYHKDRYKIISF